MTDYPLGVVEAIRYETHLALDALGAVALTLSEFSPAVSDPTGYGDYHGNLDAVRRANAEDPRRNSDDGMPGVRPAAAAS